MANYERALTLSLVAGQDFTPIAPAGGQFRFCKINPAAVVNYTNPDNPGRWYGSDGPPPPIAPGNVIVNTTAGGPAPFVAVGKALPGQPLEVAFAGRVVVLAGGTVTAGDAVQSDATGAAVTQSGSNHILGRALSSGVAGDEIEILLQPGPSEA